ncbi:hypothetical protein ADU59_03000 [Pararhizobium polonicum]|uniref:Uncharacterized protein n=1 Tax=Pararhizobium polonicum TaxID=1612624 RepID=A0A1C7P6W7_9HYPH|nr:hypothetical protein [Pararhizobium polonicum]OBZ96726.1 hypothetical protein ADU59_03000 [Pararhizobium polonicum]
MTNVDRRQVLLALAGAAAAPGVSAAATAPLEPWKDAEHHARGLAKAMATWPDCMRFQITIVPHQPEQPLFWLSMPAPEIEVGQLDEAIKAHREAFRVTDTMPEELEECDEGQRAFEAEDSTFAALLHFNCRTGATKARKVEYLLAHIRKRNRFDLELNADQLETLLDSLIQ